MDLQLNYYIKKNNFKNNNKLKNLFIYPQDLIAIYYLKKLFYQKKNYQNINKFIN